MEVSDVITAVATVASSIISGLVAIIVCTVQNNKNLALVTYRLEQLEKKVDAHNNLVERMTVLETEMHIKEAIQKG